MMTGFMLQRGRQVICRQRGRAAWATPMYDGAIYVRRQGHLRSA